MFLKRLRIRNFRKFKDVSLEFTKGLNIIVGANNIGKTAVVDALRSLLAGHEEPYSRFTTEDIHRPVDNTDPRGDIFFEFTFSGLSITDEADFISALVPNKDGGFNAKINVSYSAVDATSGRMRPKRWCGEFEEIGLNADILENLRGVYLQPLRDASLGLRPGRNSQLAKLLRLLGQKDENGTAEIEATLAKYDKKLRKTKPVKLTHKAIQNRHEEMLGNQLAQILTLGIAGTDFNRLSARLTLQADDFDIEQNGLGFNNLIFMAVVLSEMVRDKIAAYRALIVEEPEAHLHPQLQSVLLEYLESIKDGEDESDVQVFVTSHSPNFASIADLDSTICLVNAGKEVKPFFPRDVCFDENEKMHLKKRQKLERYLDVTRAELFFARKVIFVEGAAEMMLIGVLADCMGKQYNLRRHAISIISVEGLNFDSFLPLFGNGGIQVPVSVITDADPYTIEGEGENERRKAIYPEEHEEITISDNTLSMLQRKDDYVGIYHGVKTFEYDLALHEKNRSVMMEALEELHPKIASELKAEIEATDSDAEKAKALFCGMFERGRHKTNVQKGRFGQVLAQVIVDGGHDFVIPGYIKEALKHVCEQLPS